jgi:hypothetical protein
MHHRQLSYLVMKLSNFVTLSIHPFAYACKREKIGRFSEGFKLA